MNYLIILKRILLLIVLFLYIALVLYPRRLKEICIGGKYDLKQEFKKNLEKYMDKYRSDIIINKLYKKFNNQTIPISNKLDILKEKIKLCDGNVDIDKIYKFLNLDICIENIKLLNENDENDYCILYTCKKCGSKKSICREIQTRSIDEPSDLKCTCLVCGFKWSQE